MHVKKFGGVQSHLFQRQNLEKRCAPLPLPLSTPHDCRASAMGSVVQPNEWVAFRLPSGTVKIIQAIPNT